MNDKELDAVYTRLCLKMTALGEAQARLFLARFAMLAISRLDDAQAAMRLIDDAADLPDGGKAVPDRAAS